MDWRFTGSAPVFKQIMEQLRAAVLAGIYPPGARIPGVRELAAEARVNPNTMQRALSELEREGLLVSHGTLGRCVTEDDAVTDALRQEAIRAAVDDCLIRFRTLGIGPEEAAALLTQTKEE